MKSIRAIRFLLTMICQTVLLMTGLGTSMHANAHADDVLAVGDVSDDSVRFFDVRTGKLLPRPLIAPGSGGLRGPRGILFDEHRKEWLVVNQNVNLPFSGEVLRYDASGTPRGALVPRTDLNAPFAPRGIILVKHDGHRTLFVADMGDVGVPGKLLAYRVNGTQATLIANLDPNLTRPGTTGQFHPRGVVIGPDGYLYVSLTNLPDTNSNLPYACGGSVLRFDPKKLAFKDVLISNPADCSANVNDLHHPEGLVFSPRGDLYITSGSDPARCACFTNDEILIIPKNERRTGQISLPLDRINLSAPGQPIMGAQALLFGPRGHLFVPISNTGEVRRYNVDTKGFWTFVPAGRGLGQPWYLSFAKTNPATLAYDDDDRP
jgi:hypothetical protein